MRDRRALVLALSGCLLVGCGVEPTDSADLGVARQGLAGDEHVITLSYSLELGQGRRIAVRESFTPTAFSRWPRRAILFLNGTPTTGAFYDIPVDGYRGRELLARHGFFAYTVDFEGSGDSTYPADGFSLTFDQVTDDMHEVIERIRRMRHVDRVDVLGEAEGGGVAARLCADAGIVRSCTLASMLYRTPTPQFQAIFQSPEFRGLIFGLPDGYLDVPPQLYFNVLAAAPPDVASWVLANQPGRYSMGLVAEELTHVPAYDVRGASVPGLIIRGEFDQNAPASDTEELAATYGSAGGADPATIVSIPGALMLPRIEATPHHDAYWSAVLDFVDP